MHPDHLTWISSNMERVEQETRGVEDFVFLTKKGQI